MTTPSVGIFELADRKLAWIDRRQEVLAQDVANADTPGWKSRDLSPFAAALQGVALERTTASHLAGSGNTGSGLAAASGVVAPDGNGVTLDSVLGRIADTDASHELVSDLYRKYLGFFRTALGR